MDLLFRTEEAARAFGEAYIRDDEDAAYYRVTPQAREFRVDLYEADGYHINQPPPRLRLSASVIAPLN